MSVCGPSPIKRQRRSKAERLRRIVEPLIAFHEERGEELCEEARP